MTLGFFRARILTHIRAAALGFEPMLPGSLAIVSLIAGFRLTICWRERRTVHATPRRAITLGGGGPEAALHIGALAFFEQEAKVHFDIWALSSVGAWVGIYYQQCEEGKQADQTRRFFREKVFRDNISYERFPANH